MDSERLVGTVKWFASRGEAYGFINFKQDNNESAEVFVHYKQIGTEFQPNPRLRMLRKGDVVSFEIGTGYPTEKHGTQALRVVKLNG